MKRLLAIAALSVSVACTAQEMRQVGTIQTPVKLRAAAICGKGSKIIGIDADRKVHVWDVASKGESLIESSEAAHDVTCSGDAKRAAISTRDASVLIVDLTTNKVLKVFRPTKHALQGIAFDSGNHVAIATDDSAPRIYDLNGDGSVELARPFGASGGLSFSPDGSLLATPDEDTKVRIYEASGKIRSTVDCGPLEPFFTAFSQDGTKVLVSSADAIMRTVDVSSGKVVRTSEKIGTAPLAMTMSGDNALVLMMDEFTMQPQSAAIWNSKTNTARKLSTPPQGFLTAGEEKSGWLLIKQEANAISLWELN